MKYIGSGLWALAAAYLDVNGIKGAPLLFVIIGVLIVVMGSDKSLLTINNQVDKGGE